MPPRSTSRREVLQATVVAGTLVGVPDLHAAGSDLLRVGLVGCGDRGTGAATQALTADPHVRLVAMADAFEDRLQQSLAHLKQDEKVGSKVDVASDHRFVGFDACQKLLESGVDVVLLCTPPHFRPLHLQAAVQAGKHVFAEKPVAVDAPGVHSVLESCKLAKTKGLSVVSGLCLRYDRGFRKTVSRLHEGEAGEITTLLANDYRSGRWAKPKQSSWTEMYYQMRNWYNFTWLSGDFNLEQHVHFLDVCEYMARSTLLAIMGRMAAYTGQEITWEMALNSRENLGPDRYDWNGTPPVAGSPFQARHRSPDGRAHAYAAENPPGAAMPPGPWSELVALNRRTWLGITGAGIAGGLARAAGPGAGCPGRRRAPGPSRNANPVPGRLHDPAILAILPPARPDRHQGGRIPACRLGHNPCGQGRS